MAGRFTDAEMRAKVAASETYWKSPAGLAAAAVLEKRKREREITPPPPAPFAASPAPSIAAWSRRLAFLS